MQPFTLVRDLICPQGTRRVKLGVIIAAVMTLAGCATQAPAAAPSALLASHGHDRTLVPITQGTGSRTLDIITVPLGQVGLQVSCAGAGESVTVSLVPTRMAVTAVCSSDVTGEGGTSAARVFPVTQKGLRVAVTVKASSHVTWAASVYIPDTPG